MGEKIATELMGFVRLIDDARPHPDNVRRHRVDKIAESLDTHGQRALILVQASTGRIVKGNGTWMAAKSLGWEHAAMLMQELDDEQALAFLYADNRASDLANYDMKKLVSGLEILDSAGRLSATLWEPEELADVQEELDGLFTLQGTGTGAEYAALDPDFEEKAKERAGTHREGGRLKEVPLRYGKEEYTVFAEHLQILREAFHTSGTIDTTFEAVRRQGHLERTGEGIVGPIPTIRHIDAEVRAVLVDLRAVVASMSVPHFNRTLVLAAIDSATPKGEPAKEQVTDTEPMWQADELLPTVPGTVALE